MIIEINNLNFSYNENIIFKDLNLKVKKNSFIFISGSSSCGKTTLLKIISGLIEIDSNIKICEIELNKNNLNNIRKKIGIVFENPDSHFVAETVRDEISFTLKNLNIDKNEIEKRVFEISELLKIENLLDLEPHSLSGGEKEIVALASALINKPELLLIDGSLSMVDEVKKDEIFKKLKKLNKEMTIVCTTNDLEVSLYGKELILLDKNVILDKKITKAFEDEKLFKKCNLDIPFMASLSNKLKYYGLTEEIILDMDKMVNTIWK